LYDPNDTSDRKNINFSVTPDLEKWVKNFDAAMVKLAHASSVEIFGKQLSEPEVQGMYCPLYKEGKDDYAGTVKCKVNLGSSRYAVKCFDFANQAIPTPVDWKGLRVVPGVVFSGIWIQPRSFGISGVVTHAMIQDVSEECPFAAAPFKNA